MYTQTGQKSLYGSVSCDTTTHEPNIIKVMYANGLSHRQIAAKLKISLRQVQKAINPEKRKAQDDSLNARRVRITTGKPSSYARTHKPQWASKLTADQVREIRQSRDSYRDLAERFGVSWLTIYYAATGKSWRRI